MLKGARVSDEPTSKAAALEASASDAGAFGEVLAVRTDVTDAAAVEALAARVDDAFGPPQLVFANAGVTASGARRGTARSTIGSGCGMST